MISAQQLEALDPQMRQAMLALMAEVAASREKLERGRREVAHKQALIDKLTHENALLKRLKFAAQSERFTAEQRSLLDETFDADLAEVGVGEDDGLARRRAQAEARPVEHLGP